MVSPRCDILGERKRYQENTTKDDFDLTYLLPWRRRCAHRQLHEAPPCRTMLSHLRCLMNVDVTLFAVVLRHVNPSLVWSSFSSYPMHISVECQFRISGMIHSLHVTKILVTASEMWVWRRMLRITWTKRKTNTWIREKIDIPEEKGICLEQIKHRELSKYCHWKTRSDSVVLATIEGEIEGKCFLGEEQHG